MEGKAKLNSGRIQHRMNSVHTTLRLIEKQHRSKIMVTPEQCARIMATTKKHGKTLQTHTQTHKGNRANYTPISQSKNREHESTQTGKETKQKLEAEKNDTKAFREC